MPPISEQQRSGGPIAPHRHTTAAWTTFDSVLRYIASSACRSIISRQHMIYAIIVTDTDHNCSSGHAASHKTGIMESLSAVNVCMQRLMKSWRSHWPLRQYGLLSSFCSRTHAVNNYDLSACNIAAQIVKPALTHNRTGICVHTWHVTLNKAQQLIVCYDLGVSM